MSEVANRETLYKLYINIFRSETNGENCTSLNKIINIFKDLRAGRATTKEAEKTLNEVLNEIDGSSNSQVEFRDSQIEGLRDLFAHRAFKPIVPTSDNVNHNKNVNWIWSRLLADDSKDLEELHEIIVDLVLESTAADRSGILQKIKSIIEALDNEYMTEAGIQKTDRDFRPDEEIESYCELLARDIKFKALAPYTKPGTGW